MFKPEWPFCSGNVVRCPKGDLFVVHGGYFDKPTLIPFNSSNCTVHPPKEDYYENRDYEDEDTGRTYTAPYLMMHGIDKYTLVANTIHEFLVDRLVRKAVYDDPR